MSSLTGTKFDCHRGTSFSPERRAEQEKQAYDQTIAEYADAPAAMQDRLRKRYDLYLARKSRTLSPMITGPSRFPTRRNEKALDAEHRAWEELEAYKQKIERVMKRKARKEAIAEAGGPVAVKRAEIEKERKTLDTMRAFNHILKRKKPRNELSDEQREQIKEDLGFNDEQIDKLLEPDFCGRIGFPDYALNNGRARLRQKESRLAEMEAKEEATEQDDQEYPFEGGRVVYSFEYDRLRIFNDQKPPREKIQEYKRNGFRWNRFEKCWQRKLNNAAKFAANNILGMDLR